MVGEGGAGNPVAAGGAIVVGGGRASLSALVVITIGQPRVRATSLLVGRCDSEYSCLQLLADLEYSSSTLVSFVKKPGLEV